MKLKALITIPITSFGISLGFAGYAFQCKVLSEWAWLSTEAQEVCQWLSCAAWLSSIAAMSVLSVLYGIKLVFRTQQCRKELEHHLSNNFFFAPLIIASSLAIGAPSWAESDIMCSILFFAMLPVLSIASMFHYYTWFFGGSISGVAPAYLMGTVSWPVLAGLGVLLEYTELAFFLFSIGIVLYGFVLFFQFFYMHASWPRDSMLIFLNVAPPAIASRTLEGIIGEPSRMSIFLGHLSLFLMIFLSPIVVQVARRGFNLSWWALTFPSSSLAVALITAFKFVPLQTNIYAWIVVCVNILSTLLLALVLVVTVFYFITMPLFPLISLKSPLSATPPFKIDRVDDGLPALSELTETQLDPPEAPAGAL